MFTAVNPPALTGVKPEDTEDRDSSAGGVGAASPCSVAFKAKDALTAGESAAWAMGVPCVDLFMGECAGEGVKGPPCSNSSICCTPGLTRRKYCS